jgi:hypothetical protein
MANKQNFGIISKPTKVKTIIMGCKNGDINKIAFMALILVSLHLPSFAQNLTANLQVAGYTFNYSFEPISGNKYKFIVKNIANANTKEANFSLVYASQGQVMKNGNHIKEVRIYAAKSSPSNAINWTTSLADCLRFLFEPNSSSATVQTAGTMLDKYLAGTKPTTIQLPNTNLAEDAALKLAAKQFIQSYYKIMNLGKNNLVGKNLNGSTQIDNSLSYQYEIGQGAAETDKEISIRQGEKGLVFRTNMRIVEQGNSLNIKVFYAKQKDFSWEIYGSDFWEVNIDRKTGKAKAKKEGLFFPPILEELQENDIAAMLDNDNTQKQVLEWFIKTYQTRLF